MPEMNDAIRRRDNERIAALINSAWGERVAWVEDRQFVNPAGGRITMPVVVSRLVAGLLPGRRDVPPFFAGPVPNEQRR